MEKKFRSFVLHCFYKAVPRPSLDATKYPNWFSSNCRSAVFSTMYGAFIDFDFNNRARSFDRWISSDYLSAQFTTKVLPIDDRVRRTIELLLNLNSGMLKQPQDNNFQCSKDEDIISCC
uniref:Uncharacterized protein n=1 Tax=Caenorhabditis japonica TaxID=281687 RepID=A0A8R1I815_CAEJA